MNEEKALLERLARNEHKQWTSWSKTLADEEDLSEQRLERWEDNWKRYDELDEETKDHDRKYAERQLRKFRDYLESQKLNEEDELVKERLQDMIHRISIHTER